MIPNDWYFSTLGNVSNLYTGNSINEKIKLEKYTGKAAGINYISTKDINFDNIINYDTNVKIPESDGYKIAPANTTLLCMEGGSAGRKIGFTNQAICFVNKLCAFVTVNINSKFVYYFLQTSDFINQFNDRLQNIIELLSGQDFKPDEYNSEEKGVPYITGASNFKANHVVINRWTLKPTVIAQNGDVLLVCKGSGYGKAIIADFDKAHIARQIMALRVNNDVEDQFIYYFLQFKFDYIRESGQGLIPGISRKIVLNMSINLPDIAEQKEIVRILDSLLAKEQRTKELAEHTLHKIDLMKKSILARAFRGELNTKN